MDTYDYLIVGSGIAGLYTALLAREHGTVLLITKGNLDECNTKYAQGGIAAAVGEGDSPALHMEDTLAAGAGLCDPEAVRILTEEAPDRIVDLIRLGVPFDTVHGEIALGREGAHSVPRILHAGGDATGEHIEMTLGRRAREAGIVILEHCLLTQIRVTNGAIAGVRYLDLPANAMKEVGCTNLVLASGGAGNLFRLTTNPSVATGDGVAVAYLAGAEVMDMEFFQFHPTALRLPGVGAFLISEAVRGEGGILRNLEGRAFMKEYSPQKDLAPRDIVSRAIVTEMRKSGSDHVLLDVTHLPANTITTRFPHIYSFCLSQGLDITKEPVPVAPAAHYMMGGVRTNVWGEASIPGLYACGEVACVAVHGANRLASNSLLETLVFGKRVVQRTLWKPASHSGLLEDNHIKLTLSERDSIRADGSPPSLSALQSLMWEKVGIVRNGRDLEEAARTLALWQRHLAEPSDRASYELRNLVLVGRLVAEAALLRQESRGAHSRTDFPVARDEWLRHIVIRM